MQPLVNIVRKRTIGRQRVKGNAKDKARSELERPLADMEQGA